MGIGQQMKETHLLNNNTFLSHIKESSKHTHTHTHTHTHSVRSFLTKPPFLPALWVLDHPTKMSLWFSSHSSLSVTLIFLSLSPPPSFSLPSLPPSLPLSPHFSAL